MTITSTRHRPLYRIAFDIGQNWERPYFGAVPYLDAMTHLDQVTDNVSTGKYPVWKYINARSAVLYFLSNAVTWRGTTAQKIKAELKQIARVK